MQGRAPSQTENLIQKQSTTTPFNSKDHEMVFERIGVSDMLANLTELLDIENDYERGILTIHMKSRLCSDEKKIALNSIREIEQLFAQFKIEAQQQGMAVTGFTALFNNNALIIRISSPQYYDSLVQRLVDLQILNEDQLNHDEEHLMKPYEHVLNKGMDREVEEEKIVNPSPFDAILKLYN